METRKAIQAISSFERQEDECFGAPSKGEFLQITAAATEVAAVFFTIHLTLL